MDKKNEVNTVLDQNLIGDIEKIIKEARRNIASNMNHTMCLTYFGIGKILDSYGGKRVKYGSAALKRLSDHLTRKFGRGFSPTTLRVCRKFYHAYSDDQGNLTIKQFDLSWSHYQYLVTIDDPNARKFYEIEAANERWTVANLKRQYRTSLYERLAQNKRIEKIQELSQKGQLIYEPEDILKDPYVLDFANLPAEQPISEKTLENALISKLQKFLLELGKGFLFEARQKRLTIDGESYHTDLIFYNRLLRCYVLIDLKRKKLDHADIGQMQMYVGYYDTYIKEPEENPTIGILLCPDASKEMVELTVPAGVNVYASRYELYIPNKEVLEKKLKEWMEELEMDELNTIEDKKMSSD